MVLHVVVGAAREGHNRLAKPRTGRKVPRRPSVLERRPPRYRLGRQQGARAWGWWRASLGGQGVARASPRAAARGPPQARAAATFEGQPKGRRQAVVGAPRQGADGCCLPTGRVAPDGPHGRPQALRTRSRGETSTAPIAGQFFPRHGPPQVAQTRKHARASARWPISNSASFSV